MKLLKLIISASFIASSVLAAPFAMAKKGAINLQMNPFKEVITKDKDGKPKILLTKIDSAVPGDKIVYITKYQNVSQKTVDAGATITNRVPKNTFYVNQSAYCENCSITFSINGKSFATLENLNVSLKNGKKRPATFKDVKKVRWQLNSALESQDQGSVGFKVEIQKDTLNKVARKL